MQGFYDSDLMASQVGLAFQNLDSQFTAKNEGIYVSMNDSKYAVEAEC